jgi:pre-mRNA-splicing factor 18
MDKLKEEIARKKREREEAMAGNTTKTAGKYVKRGDLGAKPVAVEAVTPESKEFPLSSTSAASESKPDASSDAALSVAIKKSHAITMPKSDVIARLRAMRQPATLFGESDDSRFERLRQQELLAIVDSGEAQGQRNFAVEDAKRSSEGLSTQLNDEEQRAKEERCIIERLGEIKGDTADPSDEQDLVLRWIERMMLEWKLWILQNSAELKCTEYGRKKITTFKQCEEFMKPLNAQLKRKSLERSLCERLSSIVRHCKVRHYKKAMDEYILFAIGNAAWPIGVTCVGIWARASREKLNERNVAHILNDEATRKWAQSIKRLMSFTQRMYPNTEDPTQSFAGGLD